jgi:hypothetical protein
MFSSYCGVVSLTGWLVMLLVWATLLVMVVWGVRWLFPNRPPPADPAVGADHEDEDTSDAPVESRRH